MFSSLAIGGAVYAMLALQPAPSTGQIILDQISEALELEHQELLSELRYDLRALDPLPTLPEKVELSRQLIAEIDHQIATSSSATPLVDAGIIPSVLLVMSENADADAQRLRRQIRDEFQATAHSGDFEDLSWEIRTTWPALGQLGELEFRDALTDAVLRGLAQRDPMLDEEDWRRAENIMWRAEIRDQIGDLDGAYADRRQAVDLLLASETPEAFGPLFSWRTPWDEDLLMLIEQVRASDDARYLAGLMNSPGDDDRLSWAIDRRLAYLSGQATPQIDTASAEELAIIWEHLLDLVAHERFDAANRLANELSQVLPANWHSHAALSRIYLSMNNLPRAERHGRYAAALITLNAPDLGDGDAYEHAWTAYWSNVSSPGRAAWQTAHAFLRADRVEVALDIVLATQRHRSSDAAPETRRLMRFLDGIETPRQQRAFLDVLWSLADHQSSFALEAASLRIAASLRAPQRNAEECRLAALYFEAAPPAWVSDEARQLMLRSAWEASARINSYSETDSVLERFRAQSAILAALPD